MELQANAAGLRSLAQQLLQIANGEIDSVFYDTDPGDLEEGSLFLQITKVQAEGHMEMDEDFNGRAGFYCTPEDLIVKNCGQRDAWLHTFRAYAIPDTKMQSVLHPRQLSKTRGI